MWVYDYLRWMEGVSLLHRTYYVHRVEFDDVLFARDIEGRDEEI